MHRLWAALVAGLVIAAPSRGPADDLGFGGRGNLSLPVSPELTSALIVAQQSVAAKEWERAILVLQLILDADEDAFVSPGDPRSIQSQAVEALAALPAEGRQLYERLHGPAAEALLTDFDQQGNRAALSELVRRYSNTPAGRTGTWRLARLRQDQGASLSAALLYSQLSSDPQGLQQFGAELRIRSAAAWLAAGVASRAEEQLAALGTNPAGPVTIAGQPLALPAEGPTTIEWLRHVVGEIARPAEQPDAASTSLRLPPFLPPVDGPVWSAAPVCTDEVLASYPDRAATLNEKLAELELAQRKQAEESERILIPAAQPVGAHDRVLFRGPDRITALSTDDGGLLWTGTPVDFTYRELTEKTELPEREELTRELYLGQRAWRDETSAAISTDGRFVYTLMDCGMIGVVDPGNVLAVGRHGKGAFRDNSLQAYALSGGKLKWSIGGPVTPLEDPFGGMFFLGPPLPHEGLLYCLVEERGQVRLLEIDPDPARGGPRLLWSQGLLDPSPMMDIEAHEGRRTTPLRPIARGHVIVCPTGAGSVVAIDLVARRLLWGTAYDEPEELIPRFARRPPRVQRSFAEKQRIALDRLLDAEHWRSAEPIWVGDRVLVATPDGDNLACLRASDGKLLWDVPRDEWLFVAGCTAEHVVLVGANQVGALRLADGQEAWPSRLPITAPSGRGFPHDDRYTLPLSTHELITFDLHTGRLLASSPLPEEPAIGNLLAVDGRLISQSASAVRGFAPLENAAELLAAAAEPAGAEPRLLAIAGEALLHAGETERGVSLLRTALQKQDAPRSRLVLAAVLMERLRLDFAAHQSDAAEIERLVAGTAAELPFRRLMAVQCREQGDAAAAFRHLLLLGTLADESQPLEPVDEYLSVALDRWVAGGVRGLLDHAEAVERGVLETQLRGEFERLTALEASDSFARLRRLSPLLRGTDLEGEAALALARRSTAEQPAERMRCWLDVLDRVAPELQGEATVRLAELCLECKDPALAAPYVQALQTTFAAQPTVDGLTGAEQLAHWETDARLGPHLAAVPPVVWPAGELRIEATPAHGMPPQFLVLPVRGEVRGPLAGWTIAFDDQGQRLWAFTPRGALAWETPLEPRGRTQQPVPVDVMIDGPLVTVFWPDQLQVISAVTPDGGRVRPVQFTRSLVSVADAESEFFMQRGRLDRAGTSGPLSRDVICYQLGPILVGFDPWSGRDVWRRVQPGGVSEILGDDEFVVVRSSAQADLLVLRALDGVATATRPPVDGPLSPPEGTDWGRRFLTLTSLDDDSDQMAMYDPADGKQAWTRTLKSPVYWSTVDGGLLLVIDGDLDCVLLEPAIGRELLRVRLPIPHPEERLLRSLTTLSDAERIYLCLNDPPDSNVLQFEQQRAVGRTVNGTLCAIDRASGQLAWSTAIVGQYVDPQQPAGWPVLVLAARQKLPAQGEFSSVQVVVDKTTGKVLFEDRQIIEGLPRDFRRRASWRVDGETSVIRMQNDLRMLVISPPDAQEPAK